MDVLHLRMNGALGADLAAEAASDAERFDDFDFHTQPSVGQNLPLSLFFKEGNNCRFSPVANGGSKGI